MDLATATTVAQHTHCHYQEQDTALTLRQGLAEYRAANPHLADPDELSGQEGLGDLGHFFAAHDACHVLFGLDTSIGDEALADTWTLCATDAKWSDLASYFKSQEQRKFFSELLSDVGWWRLIKDTVAALPRVLRVIWRSRRLPQKWALYDWPNQLDRPLAELRAEYRIELV